MASTEYSRVPGDEEHGESSSSSSSSGHHVDLDYDDDHEKPILKYYAKDHTIIGYALAVPMLAARTVYLCWLLASNPVRHAVHQLGRRSIPVTFNTPSISSISSPAWWPETYSRLGEFAILVPSFLKPTDRKSVV